MQCPQCKKATTIVEADFSMKASCQSCSAVIDVPPSRLSPGMMLSNDFVIKTKLGSGGMATIFYAEQLSLQRQVALKVLHPEHASQSDQVQGFMREARMVAQLNHPGIVQVYCVGEEEGYYYFAMELVMGASVKEIIYQDEKPSLQWSLETARRVALALSHAWTNGQLVHRDIKPDNIILRSDGRVKLADLGLAKPAEALHEFGDEVEGTPQYISPEGLLGNPMDFRSDIYSLGATLYHMVTGEFPYEGRDPHETASLHVKGKLIPPHERSPDVPEYISEIVCKMMEKKLENRYQSLEELADALKQATNRIRKGGGRTTSRKSDTTRSLKSRKVRSEISKPPSKGTSRPTSTGPITGPIETNGSGRKLLIVAASAAIVVVIAMAIVIAILLFLPPEKHGPLGFGRQKKGDKTATNNDAKIAAMSEANLKPGFQAAYYRGVAFNELVTVRVDDKVDLSDPKQANDLTQTATNFSVRWSGKVRITQPGTYTFFCTADDGQNLYFKGNKVLDGWAAGPGKELSYQTEISEPGLYDIRYEWFQTADAFQALLQWSGPDIEKQFLTAEHVLHDPSGGTLGYDLLVHYRFDEKDGKKKALDSSGNGVDGTLHAGVSLGRSTNPAVGTGALKTEGGYVNVPHKFTIKNDISISLWVNISSLVTKQNILVKGRDRASPYSLTIQKDSGKLAMCVGKKQKAWLRVADRAMLTTGTWEHVVAIYSGTNSFTIYLNGVEVDTGAGEKVHAFGINADTRPLFIGSYRGKAALKGELDDLRIYSRKLQSTEIQQLYDLGKPAPPAPETP